MTDQQMPINRQEERQRYRLRSRGLPGRMLILLLQPTAFFRSLPALQESLDWFWIGLLVLLVMVFGVSRLSSSSILLSNTPSAIWTENLLAISKTIAMWIAQAVLLYLIALSARKRSHWGLCVRIAIWASVPLALMILVQILYLSNGGSIGKPGIAGLLMQWSAYNNFSPTLQKLLLALLSNLTFFTVWNLVLLYFGARNALQAKTWAIVFGILLWIVLSTFISILWV